MLAVGLMSGTSLDGVDTALCEIHGQGTNTDIRLLDFMTYEIEPELKEEIRCVIRNEKPSTDLITSLNFRIGKLFSQAVKEILNSNGLSGKDLAFVASHGQTIYHIPKDTDRLVRSTLQIGEPAVIAYDHGVDVISNFRTMDMAAGGEGAPLVPLSEFILYGEKEKTIALQNIGGIGNVTVIPKGQKEDQVFAFDTGPGNMVIDEAMKILYGRSYDEGGETARSGQVDLKVLDALLTHPYLAMNLPKSTGREDFGELYTREILSTWDYMKKEDLIATLTLFTARTIADSYRKFIMGKYTLDKVIIGGGGAHNKALIHHLKTLLPEVEVLTQDEIGLSSDAKEAIAFVILGNQTYHRAYGNILGATGAREQVILGNITPNPTLFHRKDV